MIVFLHGVPETSALWDKIRANLQAESMALALPGFGCPRPSGFGATKDDYVAWVLSELDRIGEPVDLVGHDWGAVLTYRIATAHGERLRSWAADIANGMHPDYEWHDIAKMWQTPDVGEEFFRQQAEAPAEDRASIFEAFGVGHEDALGLAEAADETMGQCILDLYRSATPNTYSHWSDAWGPTQAPGLVIHPSDDPFGDEVKSRQVADMLGARHETLESAGHWWPLQVPERGAFLLTEFLGSLG